MIVERKRIHEAVWGEKELVTICYNGDREKKMSPAVYGGRYTVFEESGQFTTCRILYSDSPKLQQIAIRCTVCAKKRNIIKIPLLLQKTLCLRYILCYILFSSAALR